MLYEVITILNELPKSFEEMLEKITLDTKTKDINLIEYLFTNQKDSYNFV